MNKQELIKHFEEMEYVSIVQMGKEAFIDMIEQLDEPQKPVIPQFVADYIEKYKEELSVREAISKSYATFEVDKWLAELDEDGNFINQNTFARAWLDGYEVEKEKRYLVKMRATKQPLFYNNMYEKIFFSLGELATQFTFKQLEEAGFGEVFNSPLFEVKEVEE